MNNRILLERSRQAVWHPCTQMKQHETLPLAPISHGKGAWLYDFDGRRYLDAVSSWWVNLFGHGNPRINAALKDQLDKLEHVMLAGFTHEPVVELSERLSRLTGLGHCFYASDGASASEIALKMSFHFWRNCGKTEKIRYVSLQNGYHGETVGALSVSDVALFKDTYAPLLRAGTQVPTPDWRLAEDKESARDFARHCADGLRRHLEKHHAHTAAFIVEPLVQGAAGMAMYHPEYLRCARAICDEFGVHLIADEIAVGFGRTGTMFACEQAEILPDFLCLSKGITGGYLPLSAVLTRDEIFRVAGGVFGGAAQCGQRGTGVAIDGDRGQLARSRSGLKTGGGVVLRGLGDAHLRVALRLQKIVGGGAQVVVRQALPRFVRPGVVRAGLGVLGKALGELMLIVPLFPT